MSEAGPPAPEAELLELVARLRDGPPSDADRRRLNALLRSDPALRGLFVELSALDGALAEHFGVYRLAPAARPGPARPASRGGPARRPRAAARRRPARWAAAAAAVAVATAAVLVAFRPAAPPAPAPAGPPVATLAAAEAADWDAPAGRDGPRPGDRLPAGRGLRLRAGVAKVGFDSGAAVLVRGPAAVTPESAAQCLVESGVVTVAAGRGFVVRTPAGRVTDLGTAFGVAVSADETEVQVFDGQVEARTAGGDLRLAGLSAAALRPDAAPAPRPFDGTRFPVPGALDPGATLLRETWRTAADPPKQPKPVGLHRLRQHPAFAAGRPDAREYLTRFQLDGAGGRVTYYGDRVSGLLVPPQTGAYTFRLTGDDCVELALADGPDPAAGRRVIASCPFSTGRDEWAKFPTQISKPVRLEAGRRYYLEAVHHQTVLGDHMKVGWTLPDGTQEWPIPATRFVRR